MLQVGSKFYNFDDLSEQLEEFQKEQEVQLWVRDSRTVIAAAKRARRKSLNPNLKYAELTYSCVFGGRRPTDQTKTHNQTSAGGCPFKVRLSTSNDGQALVVKEICHHHNHEPGKKLHDEPRRLYRKSLNRSSSARSVHVLVNKKGYASRTSVATDLPKSTEKSESSVIGRYVPYQKPSKESRHKTKKRPAQFPVPDSPDHSDNSPEYILSSYFPGLQNDELSTYYEDVYGYLPPSPISPSLSTTGLCTEDEEYVKPILDLDEALEESLADLDSVSSMELDDSLEVCPKSVICKEEPTLEVEDDGSLARFLRDRSKKLVDIERVYLSKGNVTLPHNCFEDTTDYTVTWF